MTELDFAEVRRRWLAAGGKDTGGIIGWFGPPVVERWVESEVPAAEVGELRFIGVERAGMWDVSTRGTNRVKDLQSSPAAPDFRWDPNWVIVVVRDPESSERVIIDGNERAQQLQLAVAEGTIPSEERVRLITGDLNIGVVRIAKAVSSLWR